MPSIRLVAAFLLASVRTAFAPTLLGISSFQQVDGHIYRGGQPADYGFQRLARMGVRTVIDLRHEPGQAAVEERLVRAAGMHFVHIPLDELRAPSDEQIAAVLALLDDDAAAPVFVHCRRGVDRTGTVIACYRIAHDRWGNRQALDEAIRRGMSVFERGMRRYVLNFQAQRIVAPAAPR